MNNKSNLKTAIFYSVCFIILVVLIEAIWGLTVGVLIGANLGTQEEVEHIMKEKDTKAKTNDEGWHNNLPPDTKEDIEKKVKLNLQRINWFGVTLAVSAFVFAFVGFLCGFLNRAFVPIGIIVVLSFFVDNPVVRFPHANALSTMQKAIVVLTQFAFCYLFGYLGASLGRNRDKKHADRQGTS